MDFGSFGSFKKIFKKNCRFILVHLQILKECFGSGSFKNEE